MEMQLLKSEYFKDYKEKSGIIISEVMDKIELTQEEQLGFDFYLASSAVHSSNIEGNTVNFDTYLKGKEHGLHLKTKEIQEIDELLMAYQFAKTAEVNLQNLLKAHEIITKSILVKKERGKIRNVKVGVRSDGRLIYLAIEPQFVKAELEKLFADIAVLIAEKLSPLEIFYYAAMIHLVFVNIHPFVDGNGRATRLLEKWFLFKKLGEAAWRIQSEKYYWDHRTDYYKNLQLGVNYYEVKYERSIPFLLMLPSALKIAH